MSAYNFVRGGRNFTNFFCSTAKGSFSSTPFRFGRYLHGSKDIHGQTRKLSKNVLIFLRFLPFQILKGAVAPKVVLALTPQPRAASSAKVSSGYTP